MYQIDKDKMIARIMQATGCKNDSELARKLGGNAGMVYDWKRGKKINFELLLTTFGEELDWNYIMVGRAGGSMMVQVRKIQAEVEKLAKSLQEMENK